VAGVDQPQLQPAFLQHIRQGFQLLPRRLHHHLGDALGLQPVGQRLQAGGERRVGADLLAASSPTPPTPAASGTRTQATTSSLPTPAPRPVPRAAPPPATSYRVACAGGARQGQTEETMLKRVLAADSSWCREGPASISDTGSHAPRRAELGRATHSHPSWRPTAMGNSDAAVWPGGPASSAARCPGHDGGIMVGCLRSTMTSSRPCGAAGRLWPHRGRRGHSPLPSR